MGVTDMKDNIIKIYKMIEWNSSPDVQIRGIEMANKISDLSYFIQPMNPDFNKSIWENCAEIVVNKTDEELAIYLNSLFEWLQDINWPGAFVIFERLKKFSPQLLIEPFRICISRAESNKDNEWIDYLSGIIENNEVYILLSLTQQNFLKKHYENFWGI